MRIDNLTIGCNVLYHNEVVSVVGIHIDGCITLRSLDGSSDYYCDKDDVVGIPIDIAFLDSNSMRKVCDGEYEFVSDFRVLIDSDASVWIKWLCLIDGINNVHELQSFLALCRINRTYDFSYYGK